MYYLKLFDETLLIFDMNNDMGLEISNIHEISKNRKNWEKRKFFGNVLTNLKNMI